MWNYGLLLLLLFLTVVSGEDNCDVARPTLEHFLFPRIDVLARQWVLLIFVAVDEPLLSTVLGHFESGINSVCASFEVLVLRPKIDLEVFESAGVGTVWTLLIFEPVFCLVFACAIKLIAVGPVGGIVGIELVSGIKPVSGTELVSDSDWGTVWVPVVETMLLLAEVRCDEE